VQVSGLLHVAAHNGATEVLRTLVEAGANLEETVAEAEDLGGRPLAVAARWGQTGVVKALLALGAKIEAADSEGYTALFSAAYYGEITTVKALLAAGANVNVLLCDGSSALDQVQDPEIRTLLDAVRDGRAPK
jgi:ankyrin repeat protein